MGPLLPWRCNQRAPSETLVPFYWSACHHIREASRECYLHIHCHENPTFTQCSLRARIIMDLLEIMCEHTLVALSEKSLCCHLLSFSIKMLVHKTFFWGKKGVYFTMLSAAKLVLNVKDDRWIQKKLVRSTYSLLFQHLSGSTNDNHDKSQSR
jgi:hypothetical protein